MIFEESDFPRTKPPFLDVPNTRVIGIPIGVLLSMETTIGLCDLVFGLRAFVSFKW